MTVPDLYDGATFGTVDEGVAHAEHLGFDNIVAAGVAVAETLPEGIVYAGVSLGAMPAQKLAQTRPGALGVLLYHSAVPISAYSESWPHGVDVQIHINEQDPFDDLPIARDLVEHARTHAQAELFTYPGSTHLFTDSSLADYEPESAALVLGRTLDFLQKRN